MSKQDPTGLYFVMGRCLCFGSGEEIAQEMDGITSESLANANLPVPQSQSRDSEPSARQQQTDVTPKQQNSYYFGVSSEDVNVWDRHPGPKPIILIQGPATFIEIPLARALLQWAPPIIGGLIVHQNQEEKDRSQSRASPQTSVASPPNDPDDEDSSQSSRGDQRKIDQKNAAKLGYDQRIAPQRTPFNSHGQPAYSNGRYFITRDIDSRSGGVWKMFDSSGNRLGTFNMDLSERIGP